MQGAPVLTPFQRRDIMESSQMKIVYAITERGERSYWTRIGVAYTNRDGSLNIKLDAIPVSGTMQVREWTRREDGLSTEGQQRQARSRAPRQTEATLPAM